MTIVSTIITNNLNDVNLSGFPHRTQNRFENLDIGAKRSKNNRKIHKKLPGCHSPLIYLYRLCSICLNSNKIV